MSPFTHHTITIQYNATLICSTMSTVVYQPDHFWHDSCFTLCTDLRMRRKIFLFPRQQAAEQLPDSVKTMLVLVLRLWCHSEVISKTEIWSRANNSRNTFRWGKSFVQVDQSSETQQKPAELWGSKVSSMESAQFTFTHFSTKLINQVRKYKKKVSLGRGYILKLCILPEEKPTRLEIKSIKLQKKLISCQ